MVVGNVGCRAPVLVLLLVLVCSPAPSDALFDFLRKAAAIVGTVFQAVAKFAVSAGLDVLKNAHKLVSDQAKYFTETLLGSQRRTVEKWCGRVVAERFQTTPGLLGKVISAARKLTSGIQATFNKAQKISTSYTLRLDTLSKGDMQGAADFLPFSSAQHLKKLNPATYLEAAEALGDKDWDYAQGNNILVIATAQLAKVGKNVLTSVDTVGNVACGVKDSDLGIMLPGPAAALGTLTSMILKTAVPFHTNAIGMVCSSDLFKELTSQALGEGPLNRVSADLKMLGSQVVDSVPIGRLWEMNSSQIVDVAASIGNDRISRVDHKASKITSLVHKALDGASRLSTVLDSVAGLANYMPPQEVRNLSPNRIMNGLMRPVASDCYNLERPTMAAMKGNLERAGDIIASVTKKLTAATIRSLGCVMAELPMCKYAPWLNLATLRGAVDAVGSLVGLTAGDYQRYRKHMSARKWARDSIEFFHNGNMKMVEPRTFIGTTRQEFLAIFEYLIQPLDCFLDAPAHGAAFIEAVRQAFSPPNLPGGRGIAELVPKHLEVMGDALAYLTEDDANRIASESCYVDVLASLGLSKVIPPRVRSILMNHFVTRVPPVDRTEETYINMGDLTPFIPTAELTRLLRPENEELCRAVVEQLETMDRLHHIVGNSHISYLTSFALRCTNVSFGPITEDEVRYLGALVMGLTVSDLARVEEDALDELADMVSYIQEPDEAFLARIFTRIGAARLATPAIIDRLRDHAVLLPVTAIRTFTKKTFEQTVDEFGAHPTIHDVQAEALLAQAERHWGANVAQWPKRNFYRLGYILGALPEETVATLPMELATYVAEKMSGTEGDSKAQAKAERLVAKRMVRLPGTAEEAKSLGPSAVRWFEDEQKAKNIMKEDCLVDSLVNIAKTVESTVYRPAAQFIKPRDARGIRMKTSRAAPVMMSLLGNIKLDEFSLAAMVPALPAMPDSLLSKIPGHLVNKVMDHLGDRTFSAKQAKMLVNSLNSDATVPMASKAMRPSQVDRVLFATMGTLTQAFEPATLTFAQVTSWTPKVVSQLEPGYFSNLSIPQLIHLDSAQVRAVSHQQYMALSAGQASALMVATNIRPAGDVPLSEAQQNLSELDMQASSGSNAGVIAGAVIGVLLTAFCVAIAVFVVKKGKVPETSIPSVSMPNVSMPRMPEVPAGIRDPVPARS